MFCISACGSKESQKTETSVTEESSEKEFVEETTPTEISDEKTEEKAEHGQIISISMAEMEEKLAAKEDFMVSFVTIDCPYCQDFHSMLVDYIQEHIVTMYQVILDYEDKPEEENRKLIKEIFQEFNTVPGVFYVEDGENASYHDTYNLGVGMEAFDAWVQENNLEVR